MRKNELIIMEWENIIKNAKRDYLKPEDISDAVVNDIGKDIEQLVKKYEMTDSMKNELEELKESGFTRNISRSLVIYYAIQQYIKDKVIDLDINF